jgi:hypothetical protein
VAAYDRIEAAAAAVRRKARSQAQAAREEEASERLQALLPVTGGAGAGPGGPQAVARAAVVDRCPHCRQPVAVVLVAAAPGDLSP